MPAMIFPPGSVFSLADMKAYDVRYPGYQGEAVPAYVARPAAAGVFPGIIIVHGVHGLEEHIKDVARRFAVFGYAAIAPALFSREEFLTCVEEKDVEKSVVWTRQRPDAQTIGDLTGALTYLQQQPFVNDRIGLIGFCSGGRAALVFACSTSSLRVFVNCYSNGILLTNAVNPVTAVERVKDLSCPMLGMFGADDTNPSPADVERLRLELEMQGKPHEIVIYKHAAHAFFSDTRASYRPEASHMAWGRMLEWFSRYLKP